MSQPQPRQVQQEDRVPYDAGNPAHVHGKEKRVKELERRRIEGLKLIVDNENARLWLWDLLQFCGISRSSFTGNSTTFFNEGARNVGLKMQAELVKHYPESYITMMKEGEKNAST